MQTKIYTKFIKIYIYIYIFGIMKIFFYDNMYDMMHVKKYTLYLNMRKT